ncbi:hypothetical protein J4439_06920 [Candidatus Woesearchaeota archaeon]|nr:hypothetical protein [Candidatus Woesearchaeota archaeon]
MNTRWIALAALALLLLAVAYAASTDESDEIEEGRRLVESGVSCSSLDDEELEAIGEYLMEQMHPGASHEAMHRMMGIGDGTEAHKLFHVRIAQMHYCGGAGESDRSARGMMSGGMMQSGMGGMMGNLAGGFGRMMGGFGGGMIGGGMMSGRGMMSGAGCPMHQ